MLGLQSFSAHRSRVSPDSIRQRTSHNITRIENYYSEAPCHFQNIYDFNSLFLFSLLFSLSTRFLCIVSAIFSYRAFSSLAALLSLIVCMRR